MTIVFSIFGLLLTFLSLAGLFNRVSLLYSFPLLLAALLSLSVAMSDKPSRQRVLWILGSGLPLYGLLGLVAGLPTWMPNWAIGLGIAYLAAAVGNWIHLHVPPSQPV